MKPIDQTEFGKKKGNCFAACVASILELPLDQVPDLRGAFQYDALEKFLKTKELTFLEVVLRPRAVPPEWFRSFGMYGWGYCIANGKSPRGDFDHSVILKVDHTYVDWIHDPHPDRKFIEDLEGLLFIIPRIVS